jgi:hypothetical protein
MPKGRMLNKKISQDEKVAKLSLEATLLYTWCIPYLDVKGRMHGNIWSLKAIVPNIKELTPQKIENCIKEWITSDLVFYYGDSQKYLEFKGFLKNQKIREEQESKSEIPSQQEFIEQQSNNGVKTELKQSNSAISKVKESKGKESEIFSFWLSKKITPRITELDEDTAQVIGKALEKESIETIKMFIEAYSEILKGEQYFFKTQWNLSSFLSRRIVSCKSGITWHGLSKEDILRNHLTNKEQGQKQEEKIPRY